MRRALAALIGIAMTSGYALPAGHVLIVMSSEASAYEKAATALTTRLAADNITTRSVILKTLGDSALKKELKDKPAAVVALGTAAAANLSKRLPADVLLTYGMVSDPSKVDVVAHKLTRGVTTKIPIEYQLETLLMANLKTDSIGMLYRSKSKASKKIVEDFRAVLPKRIRLVPVAIEQHTSVAAALDVLVRDKVDIIWTHGDSKIYTRATVRALLLRSVRHRIPVFGFSTQFVKAGALVGVGVSPGTQGTQLAKLTLRAIAETSNPDKGIKPFTAQAPEFDIAINLMVARKLSVNFPAVLIDKATEIYGQ